MVHEPEPEATIAASGKLVEMLGSWLDPPFHSNRKWLVTVVPVKLNDWHTCVTLIPSFGTRTPVLQCKMILR